LLLNIDKRQRYKYPMREIVELGLKDPPRAISAEELQTMLGTAEAFCSWDASSLTVSDLLARWPFLFSRPLLGTNKEAHTIDTPNAP
jgi:hypothetical protein